MSAPEDVTLAELRAEREMSVDEVWAAAAARLDWPMTRGLNTAHECADRWGRDRARLAMIFRHPDGSSDRWTFADFAHASSRLATAWLAAGLTRGDRVAGIVGQQAEAYIGALAAWRAGLVYMPLFAGFGPAALAERLEGGQPSAVVVDHRFRDQLTAALESTTSLDPAIYTVAGPSGRGIVPGDRAFWAELESHDASTAPVETSADDYATLIYTSGTTGSPKGCMQVHGLTLAVQPFVRHSFGLGAGDLLFAGADPGWSYGLYAVGVGPMSQGRPRVVYTGGFDPEAWLRIFEEERVTHVAAAPSAYRRLLTSAQRRGGMPASVRVAGSAGEPLDIPLATAWRDLTGHDILDAYGQSEMGMVLGNFVGDSRPVVPGVLGSVVPGFEIELVDLEGNPSEPTGIIALKDPRYQAAKGYLGREDLWENRWRGKYFLSGDLAERDAGGGLRFVGREDDLIITSGYNVGPSEVENLILAHPAVAEAAVVAAPDDERGSVVRAFLVLNGTAARDEVVKEIKQSVADGLGRHAAPRIIEFISELPRTETGKVRRNVLRDM